MSTTAERRSLSHAITDAIAFRDRFKGHYERWEFAGSIRRRAETIGDVEHVVIGANLFARLDELVAGEGLFANVNPEFTKATYGEDKRTKWGELARGVMFRGFKHELYLCDSNNWGSILAIRTGPAGYSKHLVTMLSRFGAMKHKDGRVIETRTGNVIPTPDEARFLGLCGVAVVDPALRRDPFDRPEQHG